MKILSGVGNRLHGDGGAGCYIADNIRGDDGMAITCATAPENFTGIVRKHHPELLVIVDAASMGLAPGTLRRVAPEMIEGAGLGTHMLPMSHLVGDLAGNAGEILFIGIEPGHFATCNDLSLAVREGVDALITVLQSGLIDAMVNLEGERLQEKGEDQ